MFADIDGDTAVDMVWSDDDARLNSTLHLGPPAMRVVRVREGSVGASPGTAAWGQRFTYSVEYEPLHADGRYQPELPKKWTAPACVYPVSCRRPNKLVVARHHVDTGDVRSFEHRYYDARRHRLGRGQLGFGAHRVDEKQYATTTIRRYDNHTVFVAGSGHVYPYARNLVRELMTVDVGGEVHERERTFAYAVQTLTAGWRPYLTERVVEKRAGGAVIKSVTKRVTIVDGYGNALKAETIYGDGSERVDTFEATYANDPASWLIGQRTLLQHKSKVGAMSALRTTAWSYDPVTGALVQATREPYNTADSSWTLIKDRDKYGNVLGVSRGANSTDDRVTETTYDSDGIYPAQITNPLGHKTHQRYNAAFGELWVEQRPNGDTTRWAFDGLGRVGYIKRSDLSDVTAQRTRVDDGGGTFHLETSEISSTGARDTTVYDWRGLPVRHASTSLGGQVTVIDQTFDPRGNLVQTTAPAWDGDTPAGTESRNYDNLGRLTRHVDAAGAVTKLDRDGPMTTVTDALGNVSRIFDDDQGQLARVVDSNDGDTRYLRGPFGSLNKVLADQQDPSTDIETRIVTDAYGRIVELHDPDTGVTYNQYDPFGQLELTVDAKGQWTAFEYDELGRITSRKNADGASVYTYDMAVNGVGRKASTVSPDGIVHTYRYNAAGAITKIATSVPGSGTHTRAFGFDSNGRVVQETYAWPMSETLHVRYDYDAHGWLERVSDFDAGETLWTLNSVTPGGHVSESSWGTAVAGIRHIDDRSGRLNRNEVRTTKTILDLQFKYDAKRNLTERRDALTDRWQQLAYDRLDRLVKTQNCYLRKGSNACTEDEYGYDDTGNLLFKSDVGDIAYDGYQPHAISSTEGGAYKHDKNGNQLIRPDAEITYNTLDRMSKFVRNGVTATLAYDVDGVRIVKDTGVLKTITVGAMESQVATKPKTKTNLVHLRAYGRLVAAVGFDNGTRFVRNIHTDHLGSPALVTDTKGAVVGRPFFDPFGQIRKDHWDGPLTSLAPTKITRGFTGHRHDEDLGLINMVGRDYDPRLGRFMTADPFVQAPGYSQSLNRYAYVWNQPARKVDPTGFAAGDLDEDSDTLYQTVVTAEDESYDIEVYVYDSDFGGDPPDPQFPAGYGGTASDRDTIFSAAVDFVPVVGAFKAFDEDTEAFFRAIENEEYFEAYVYLQLAELDAVMAIVEGLTLGTATLGTAPARAGLRRGARMGIDLALDLAKKKGCFVSGTPVWTPTGLRPIESIALNDLVLALDPDTGEMAYKRVVWVKPPERLPVLGIELTDARSYTEVLKTTGDHPFFTRNGWTDARNLLPGDEVFSSKGGWLRVGSGTWVANDKLVFNFEVEDFHTYFVGDLGAFVHNNDCTKAAKRAARKQTGSYTNTHVSGKTYHGKGTRARSQKSGRRVAREHDDPLNHTDWSPAENHRDAFKQESRRLDADRGYQSDANYNRIEQPGKKYRIKDGETTP